PVVLLELNLEEILWIAEVILQASRQFRKRLEEVREDGSVDPKNRVVFIDDVVVDGAIIGIDHDLDRVPDVVESGYGLCVWKSVGRRVGILNPDQSTAIQHEIGIAVELQERRDLPDAILHATPDLQPAFWLDVVGQQDVEVAQHPREEQLPKPVADG